jgi:hypothetical protein
MIDDKIVSEDVLRAVQVNDVAQFIPMKGQSALLDSINGANNTSYKNMIKVILKKKE